MVQRSLVTFPPNLTAQREGVELPRAGDDIVDSRQAQTMPGHQVVAGGDGRADARLEPLDRLGDAQARAGDENRFDRLCAGETARRLLDRGDGNAGGVAVVAPV
jgi:hypothetical protein